MFGLDFSIALENCELKNQTILPCRSSRLLILFMFDGSKRGLAQYLYYLMETDYILILSPSNRKLFTDTFHGQMPFNGIWDGHSLRLEDSSVSTVALIDDLYRDGIRIIIPTSGSTSRPKLVCFSKKILEKSAENISSALSLTPDATAYGYLPICFSYGLSVLHSHLISGGRFLLPAKDEKFIQGLAKSSCTHYYCVPSMLNYAKRFSEEIFAKSNAKLIAQAGGGITFEDSIFWFRQCQENEIEFVKMYGQTECGPRLSVLREKDFLSGPGSVGFPINGVSIAFETKSKEIKVYSESLADCIMHFSSSGWSLRKTPTPFHTGDLGYLENGLLYITGRKNRFAKVQDLRLSLEEVEHFVEREVGFDVAAIEFEGRVVIIPSQHIEHSLAGKVADYFGLAKRNIHFFEPSDFLLNSNHKKDYRGMHLLALEK